MSNRDNEQRAFWNAAADPYRACVEEQIDDPRYGPFELLPGEKELRLLGDLQGQKILVLGFGTGNDAIALAKMGADVTAIDISEKQVEKAKTLAEKYGISVNFLRGSFNDLNVLGFEDEEFTSVFSSSLQYAGDLDLVFNQVSRVLAPDGRFAFSLAHPDFLGLNYETKQVDREFTPGWVNLSVSWYQKAPLTVYRRPISEVEDALLKNGFVIDTQKATPTREITQILRVQDFGKSSNVLTTAIFGARKPA